MKVDGFFGGLEEYVHCTVYRLGSSASREVCTGNLRPRRYFFTFVGLSVCLSVNKILKSSGPILMKLGGRMRYEPGTNQLDFGMDLDLDQFLILPKRACGLVFKFFSMGFYIFYFSAS